jgi:hypothetical protein
MLVYFEKNGWASSNNNPINEETMNEFYCIKTALEKEE